ncbi:glycosyltransferase family 4 protein [Arcobacter sp. YIC-80]|uniref:glycosyltransferase family 4 protein n=1 Tax=Arcobacter sp. YIC-80 TaxID=3376683 RepID=UPI00384A46E4
MEKFRVVQVLPELNEGGVERGTVESSREYVKKGFESIVISNGGKLVSQIQVDGGKHYTFDVCSKNILTVLLRIVALKKLLNKINPDIIHVRSRVPAWLVYFAKKNLKAKIISTVHGFNSVGFYSSIMTKADHIICVSNSIKEYIQTNYQTSSDIISVIPRGVDTKLFNKKNLDKDFKNDFKNKYDLNEKFVVSIVGRVTQLKDYETFIKAILEVKKSIPNVRAIIVGGVREDKKEYFDSLKKLIKDLALENTITFTGSQSKIAEVYDISNVVVSSSKKPESFGRAVAEAIALNTPVVATNHGGVKDIIIENENGFFFEIGDVKELSKKIIKCGQLNFDGLNYIKSNFSLENMIEKTIAVYKGVHH